MNNFKNISKFMMNSFKYIFYFILWLSMLILTLKLLNPFNPQLLFIVTFIYASMLYLLIESNYFGSNIKYYFLNFTSKSYFTIYFTLFFTFLLIFYLLSYFDISIITFVNEYSFNCNISYLGDVDVNSTESTSNNLPSNNNNPASNNNAASNNTGLTNNSFNNSRVNVTIPTRGIQTVAAVGSSAAGVGLALKAMHQMPGSPGVKAAAGVGTMLIVQTGSYIMSKALSSSNKSDSNTKDYIMNLVANDSGDNIFSKFPFNIFPEIDMLIYCQFLFLTIQLNLFIGSKLASIDYSKYIPNNKLGKLINWFLTRYINIWTKSYKTLMIYSWFMILFTNLMLKICLYFITNAI